FVNWYDPAAKHTRRSSTRSRDLERAKQKLFEAAHATPPDDPLSPAAIDIAAVQRFYSSHHVKEKGKGIRDKSGPRQAFAHLSRYLASVGAAGKVADLTLAHQVAFMKWCRDEQKLSSKTIKTYLSYIKAALRFCSRPHIIRDARGRQREVQILSGAPHINDAEDHVLKETELPKSAPRE